MGSGGSEVGRGAQAREGADRVQVGGAAGPPVVTARFGFVGVPQAVAVEAELDVAVGVGEVVVPGAEGGEVGGEQEGAGAVEAAGRWVPGVFEDGESFDPALSPGGD